MVYRESPDAAPEKFYISPRVTDVLGYSPDEWTWTEDFWKDRVHPDDQRLVFEIDDRSNETREPYEVDYRFLHGDGRWVWVRDEATFVPESDGDGYWQGFLLDITERKESESQLERALDVEREATHRLRALDEMKNTFLQAVSHDLRTPLAAILGLAITLERRDVHLEEDDARDLARRIAGNARALGSTGHEPARPRPAGPWHRGAETGGGRRCRTGPTGVRGITAGRRRQAPDRSAIGGPTRGRRESGTDRREPARELRPPHPVGRLDLGRGASGATGRVDRGRGRRHRRACRPPGRDLRTVPPGPRCSPAFSGRGGGPHAGAPVRRAARWAGVGPRS